MKEKSLKLEISNGFLINWGYALWGAACIESKWDVRAVSVAREWENVYDMYYCQVLSETLSCFLKWSVNTTFKQNAKLLICLYFFKWSAIY